MFYLIFKELFYIFTCALVVFSVMEIMWSRIVINYINLNCVLIFWLIIGIVMLLNKNNYARKNI